MDSLRLSIHQTYGQIGIQTNNASQTIESPRGTLSIEQPPPQLQIELAPGQLTIDSSAAWDALGVGGNLAWSSRIYSQCKAVVLQAIAKTAEEGRRIGDLLKPGNPYAEIARNRAFEHSPIEYTGPFSTMNVRVDYKPKPPVIQAEVQRPVISYTPQKPVFQFQAGSVDIDLRRKYSIDIRVSKYDLYQ